MANVFDKPRPSATITSKTYSLTATDRKRHLL